MKLLILIIFLDFVSQMASGQANQKEINAGGYILQASVIDSTLSEAFFYVGEMPEFPGGEDSLFSFAEKNLYYPQSAINDSIQGKLILNFSVDTAGNVYDEKVDKGIRIDLDTVCLSMLKKMPSWKPAYIGTKAVSVKFIWPIKFTLVD